MCIALGGKVGGDDLFDRLADAQRIENLQIGEALKEDDALHETVGVLHLLDRFLAPFLGEFLIAPIVEHAVM